MGERDESRLEVVVGLRGDGLRWGPLKGDGYACWTEEESEAAGLAAQCGEKCVLSVRALLRALKVP